MPPSKKPSSPLDTAPLWPKLYAAAAEFQALAPWEFMDDSELIGIHDPASGHMDYACVLGGLGQVLGMVLYRGPAGYALHCRMAEGAGDFEAGELAAAQDCLMAEFLPKSELEPADRKAAKNSGLKLRAGEGWPVFRSHVPGYAPAPVSDDEAQILFSALFYTAAAARLIEDGRLDPGERPGQVFCVRPDAAPEKKFNWEPAPDYKPAPPPPPAVDPERVARLKARNPGRDEVWEAAAPYARFTTKENGRSIIPRAAMVVHQASFFILGSRLSGPEVSAAQAVTDAVLEAAENCGRIPAILHVRGEEMARMLEPLGRALGLSVQAQAELAVLMQVHDEMNEHMTGSKAPPPERSGDRRALEKITSNVSRALAGQNFTDPEQANRFLKELQESGRLDETRAPESAEEAAQNLMYEAFDLASPGLRAKKARRALEIFPDCADAYTLLAEETTRTPKQAKELYEKGAQGGKRALGPKFFEENTGQFWGNVQARPYMRALAGLAGCQWALGEREAALGTWGEMLRLNPGDNQGMRYVLGAKLGELGRFDELRQILGRYKDDAGLELRLLRVLAVFQKEGATPGAFREFREAYEHNKHFPGYLTGELLIPRRLPDRIAMGTEGEAAYAVSETLPAWKAVPGALDWARAASARLDLPKTGRNEPCPCGSGKKHKKCCAG